MTCVSCVIAFFALLAGTVTPVRAEQRRLAEHAVIAEEASKDHFEAEVKVQGASEDKGKQRLYLVPGVVPPANLRQPLHPKPKPMMSSVAKKSARSEGLALALDDGTRKSHSMAENTQFVTGFFKGISTKSSFSRLVASLYFVYKAMEKAFDETSDERVKALDYPELRRLEALEKDMQYYFGNDWKTTVQPSPATQKYVNRIRQIAVSEPYLLVGHMYSRYLGDLFGGQMMGGMARTSLKLDDSFGTKFYEFRDIPDTKAFIESWYTKLNELDLTDAQKQAIVDEGNLVFTYNIDLFNELEGGKRAMVKSVWRLLKDGVRSWVRRKRSRLDES